jgi:hypothetical protein
MIKKWNQKNVKECNKRESHISSKLHMIYISSNNVRHPVTLRPSLYFTQVHFTPFHYTCRHFTFSHLHFTQLHFTTLSVGFTPSKFSTAPFYFTSLYNVTLWRVRVTIVVVETQECVTFVLYRQQLKKIFTVT